MWCLYNISCDYVEIKRTLTSRVCALHNLVAAGNESMSQVVVEQLVARTPAIFQMVMKVRVILGTAYMWRCQWMNMDKLHKLSAFLRGCTATHYYALTLVQHKNYTALMSNLEVSLCPTVKCEKNYHLWISLGAGGNPAASRSRCQCRPNDHADIAPVYAWSPTRPPN